MTRGFANLFNIQRPNTFLDARGARIGRGNDTGEVGNEGHHTGDSEHQGWVITDQRRRGNDRVPAVTKKGKPSALNFRSFHNLVNLHASGRCL